MGGSTGVVTCSPGYVALRVNPGEQGGNTGEQCTRGPPRPLQQPPCSRARRAGCGLRAETAGGRPLPAAGAPHASGGREALPVHPHLGREGLIEDDTVVAKGVARPLLQDHIEAAWEVHCRTGGDMGSGATRGGASSACMQEKGAASTLRGAPLPGRQPSAALQPDTTSGGCLGRRCSRERPVRPSAIAARFAKGQQSDSCATTATSASTSRPRSVMIARAGGENCWEAGMGRQCCSAASVPV